EPAVRRFSKDRARLRERLFRGSDGEHDVIFRDDEVGRGWLVSTVPPQGDNLHSDGQGCHEVAERFTEQFRIAQGDFEYFQVVASGDLDLRLQEYEGEVEEQNRPRHAERISDRITDRGIVVAECRNRR